MHIEIHFLFSPAIRLQKRVKCFCLRHFSKCYCQGNNNLLDSKIYKQQGELYCRLFCSKSFLHKQASVKPGDLYCCLHRRKKNKKSSLSSSSRSPMPCSDCVVVARSAAGTLANVLHLLYSRALSLFPSLKSP